MANRSAQLRRRTLPVVAALVLLLSACSNDGDAGAEAQCYEGRGARICAQLVDDGIRVTGSGLQPESGLHGSIENRGFTVAVGTDGKTEDDPVIDIPEDQRSLLVATGTDRDGKEFRVRLAPQDPSFKPSELPAEVQRTSPLDDLVLGPWEPHGEATAEGIRVRLLRADDAERGYACVFQQTFDDATGSWTPTGPPVVAERGEDADLDLLASCLRVSILDREGAWFFTGFDAPGGRRVHVGLKDPAAKIASVDAEGEVVADGGTIVLVSAPSAASAGWDDSLACVRATGTQLRCAFDGG